MRPAIEHLIPLLRPRPLVPDLPESAWHDLLSLAETEHVLPVVAVALRSHEHTLPSSVSERLRVLQRLAALSGFYWSCELKSLLTAFQQSDIRVVPLKGPFLADRLYGDSAMRVSRDLDLLVSKRDLARAEDLLHACSFTAGVPDDYHCTWSRGTTAVELHHNVANPLAYNFDPESALERSRPAAFLNQPCWKLAPEDELLYLCLHAVRHRFERLSLLVDLRLAFLKLADAPAWNPRHAVRDLDPLIALSITMARRLDANLSDPHPLTLSEHHRRHLDRVAARLWQSLLDTPPEPLDWSSLHRFFVELELPGLPRLRRRIRHSRILLARVIGPDLDFASRLGLRRSWQVHLVRPLRLVRDRLRSTTEHINAHGKPGLARLLTPASGHTTRRFPGEVQ